MKDIPLIYQEEGFLVVDKPSGLLSQPGLGPCLQDSLISRLQEVWPQANLVHRLDRDTSGLLLIALDPFMHRALSRLFMERTIQKTYRAHVMGCPEATEGRIEAPLAKHDNNPPRYAVDPNGKPSRTDWRLVETYGTYSSLDLFPWTGRSHQLRVHLAHLGHPIIGDPIYCEMHSFETDRLHLHATRLSFTHPMIGSEMNFVSASPF